MATNLTVIDSNYPDNSKTVVVDLKSYVLTGAWGDEEWVVSVTTTATASGSASIQDFYIDDFVRGWSKSSDFNQGPYTINSGQNALQVSINGSSYRSLVLTNQVNPVTGVAVAADMQTKIQELAMTGALEAGNIAFKNASVVFENGRFKISSGTPTNSYTGAGKSSVQVALGASNDVAAHLGFYAPVESVDIAGQSVDETYLTFAYVASSGSTYLDVYDQTVATAAECLGITDGTNTEYRYVSSVVSGKININAALSNNYASNSRVQILKLQDPESMPSSDFSSVDDCVRFAVASVVNQIDFS